MADKWMSVVELSRASGVPESTVRRYTTRHEGFFTYEERSRGKRYHPASVELIARIQMLYADGMDAEQIDEMLGREFPIIHQETAATMAPPPSTTGLVAMNEKLDEIIEINRMLVGVIRQQQEQIQARDAQLLHLMHRIEEQNTRQLELSAAQQDEQKQDNSMAEMLETMRHQHETIQQLVQRLDVQDKSIQTGQQLLFNQVKEEIAATKKSWWKFW